MKPHFHALLVLVAIAAPGLAQEKYPAAVPEKSPILFDTDLGSDIDDAFALALILASPELDLRGVTTVSGDTQVRALMACRFLTMTGRRHTQVAAGAAPQPEREISQTGQYRYYYHPDVIFNRTTRPAKESAADFLYGKLKAQPGKITIVAAGPLTNIARLIAEKPDCKPWIRRIIWSRPGNVQMDIKAAQTVFTSGVPLVILRHDAITDLKLDAKLASRVFSPGTALTLQVQAMYQLWDQQDPVLADPLAVALCIDETFARIEDRSISIDDKGTANLDKKGKPNVRLVTSVKRDEFLKWYVERMENTVAPSRRPAKLIAMGAMPHRVHVAEDFATDIERFWWMSGKAETKNVPPGSKRVCRGVLTHDFDDLLGHTKAMYNAVILNPVPGPPMGKHTLLSFRYHLKGTGTLRVAIYSLTNGYHRHLVLTGLPQDRWESGTVDMTVARRPDGTGGPLSENERIDDIQFYVDAAAEVFINDIVLYDAAGADEKRPFPKHIHYRAGFDTGQKDKHWPGTFEIVANKGAFWHAAHSTGPLLRVHLRGERPMRAATHLSFRYRLSGADNMRVAMTNSTAKVNHVESLKGLKKDEWAEATVDFTKSIKAGDLIDEIHFLLPAGADLYVDDLLLYEPAS